MATITDSTGLRLNLQNFMMAFYTMLSCLMYMDLPEVPHRKKEPSGFCATVLVESFALLMKQIPSTHLFLFLKSH